VAPMTQYEVFWLKELTGGDLGGLYGAGKFALEELPVNAMLADRIRALSIPGVAMELFLPYQSVRERNEWPTFPLDLPVQRDGGRRIVVGDETRQAYAALLAGPKMGGTAPIVFQQERVWKASDWETMVRPMVAAHGITLDEDWSPAGPFEVRWTIELPRRWSGAWTALSHRRTAKFHDQFRGASTSLQMALRAWLPFQYFADAARYQRHQFAHPYIVYSLLPPHPARRKTQLTFHVLEPEQLVSSMRRLTKFVKGHLRAARYRMRAEGIRPDPPYVIDEAETIIEQMRGLPRTFASLMALEAFIVEEFVTFAAAAHESRFKPTRARNLVEPGLQLLHNLRCRLQRRYGGESYTSLLNLILVAATAGLVWREEPHSVLEARVQVTDLTTGREMRGESKFSYANLRHKRTLLRYENDSLHDIPDGVDSGSVRPAGRGRRKTGGPVQADSRRADRDENPRPL
jgi:hypothetical protein